MLHRTLRFAAVIAVAVLLFAPPANAQWPVFHYHQVWGTWLHKVEGVPLPALVTIQFGGTLNVTSGFMFGGGYPMRTSPIHGVWEQSGPRSIAATSLFLVFDANGVMTGYQRNRCSLKFKSDFSGYQGTEYMETVACGQAGCPDPLDPATVWTPFQGMPPAGFVVSGQRLEMVAPAH